MKILLQSCAFCPSTGGTETATRLLARGLKERGHEIKVVTDTEGESHLVTDLEVHRCISPGKFLELMRWCDVYVQSNMSLRSIWPLLIHRRPWVVVHHSLLEPVENEKTLASRVKQQAPRFATNLAVSPFMAAHLLFPSIVVHNPYADDVFRIQPEVERDRHLIIVGRLNEDKGFQVAIEALHHLHQRGRTEIRLTLAGEGPHQEPLLALIQRWKLEKAVDVVPFMLPEKLAHTFNRHRILIVPSLVQETFGLVAIEGMACGCFVAGSDVGNLKNALGPGGLTFPAGDAKALADLIEIQLDHPEIRESYLHASHAHLTRFAQATVIPLYEERLQQIVDSWNQ